MLAGRAFVQKLSAFRDFPHEVVAHVEAFLHLFRRSHQDVERQDAHSLNDVA
jgi:hypothetical protein